MSGKKAQQKGSTPTKYMHNDPCLTDCLKGYSVIKCGGGKTLSKQEAEMTKFFHGKSTNCPSQIKLLCEAS